MESVERKKNGERKRWGAQSTHHQKLERSRETFEYYINPSRFFLKIHCQKTIQPLLALGNLHSNECQIYSMMYHNLPQEHYYVYILQCSNRAYYIGLTNDLMKRFTEHENGKYTNCYTFKRRPLKLLYYETIPFLKEAVEREIQLKKWSRKRKKH